MLKTLKSLAIYGSHDASICIMPHINDYRIYELERIFKQRNYHLNQKDDFSARLCEVRDIIRDEYEIADYGVCYYADIYDNQLPILKSIFGFEHFEKISHHYAHAAGAIYQSPFNECLIISSDGGGLETDGSVDTFCIFHANKSNTPETVLKKIATLPIDLCNPYTYMAIPIKEIHKGEKPNSLSYAGKIMGLAAYGNLRYEWVDSVKNFYYKKNHFGDLKSINDLGNEIGLDLSGVDKISGQDAYDLAMTSQFVFEELSIKFMMPFREMHNKLPVLLTGGAALNVLLNQRIKNLINRPVFVPCNPNDCGLSFGMMAIKNPPNNENKSVTVSYNGIGILDYYKISEYVIEYNAELVDEKKIATLLYEGKIIGLMNGSSECGARALGNRSIICNPSFPEMKKKINNIKKREFYRPFAPICKAEDVGKYFEFEGESEFMSFAPKVRKEFWHKIPAIVHNDKTARIQTITNQQNSFIYNVIDELEKKTGIGIILNTSFNIKGLPILTTISDALEVLNTTELDYVFVEGYLFSKKQK